MAARLDGKQGNKSEKLWRGAVQRAVNRRVDGKRGGKWLERLADRLVKTADGGDVSALREIGDRLDGKPAQAVDVAVAVQITKIERLIVDPADAKLIEHDSDS